MRVCGSRLASYGEILGVWAMDVPSIAALAVAFAVAVGLWGRGLVRGRRGDLLAGAGTLAALCAVAFVMVTGCVFNLIGLMIGGFGLATFLIGPFAAQDCPLVRRDRLALGAGAVAIGVFLQMIL
ncbi:MAG: hypothetical protein GXY74_13205 [Phycisphaerae bacterium]|nr:hypothetical protein [Phycisphaerae bacterium]